MEILRDKTLLNKQRQEVLAEAELSHKVVGLYFSASWCVPSREFTPELASVHDALLQRQAPFQVVYVPCDKNQEAMWQYVDQQHGNWLLVPFGSTYIEALKEEFDIQAVPKLIIVKDTGDVITTSGRKEIHDRGIAAFRSWYNIYNPTNHIMDILNSIDNIQEVKKKLPEDTKQ